MKITILAGRAHVKHTEGGDFREATYRAVRNGLMRTESLLLEPYYVFRLELPDECVGRAMTDIQRMNGTFAPAEQGAHGSILTGTAPGLHHAQLLDRGCLHTPRDAVDCRAHRTATHPATTRRKSSRQPAYDPTADVENTPDSVFCSHGAGYVVKWDEVPEHAHADTSNVLKPKEEEPEKVRPVRSSGTGGGDGFGGDAELRALFERTYGPVKNRGFEAFQQSRKKAATLEQLYVTRIREDDYLLVDGYNIIFSWDELRDHCRRDVNAAREAARQRAEQLSGRAQVSSYSRVRCL